MSNIKEIEVLVKLLDQDSDDLERYYSEQESKLSKRFEAVQELCDHNGTPILPVGYGCSICNKGV